MIEVPIPPSTNRIWRFAGLTGRGARRVRLSKEYASWLSVAILALRVGLPRLDGPCRVVIRIHSGTGWGESRRDLDNVIKPLIDALRKSDRIIDDNTRYVRQVDAAYVASDTGVARCYVDLQPEAS